LIYIKTLQTDMLERSSSGAVPRNAQDPVQSPTPGRLHSTWHWHKTHEAVLWNDPGYDGCCFLSWCSCRPAACVGVIVRHRIMGCNGTPHPMVMMKVCEGKVLLGPEEAGNGEDPVYCRIPGLSHSTWTCRLSIGVTLGPPTTWQCSEAPVPVITRTSYREMNRGFCAILLLGIIIQETRV